MSNHSTNYPGSMSKHQRDISFCSIAQVKNYFRMCCCCTYQNSFWFALLRNMSVFVWEVDVSKESLSTGWCYCSGDRWPSGHGPDLRVAGREIKYRWTCTKEFNLVMTYTGVTWWGIANVRTYGWQWWTFAWKIGSLQNFLWCSLAVVTDYGSFIGWLDRGSTTFSQNTRLSLLPKPPQTSQIIL